MESARSHQFITTMVTLGRISTLDVTKLSDSTMRSISSHIRTLERNGIELSEDSLTQNTSDMLDSLRDKHDKPLTEGYKRQIGMTIKRLFPRHTIDLSKYNVSRNPLARTRLQSPDFTTQIRKVIDTASLCLKKIYASEIIEDLAMYDTCHAILLSCSTSLRINEILQLRTLELEQIKQNKPINIRNKHHTGLRVVAPNDLLLSIFNGIMANRPKVANAIRKRSDPTTLRHHTDRFEAGCLITSSEDYMRKKLHVLAASNHLTTMTLGFNSFRKYITTTLIEGGGHFAAQAMNNHSTLNMTLDHYNVLGPQSTEKAYSQLLSKPLSKLVPLETIRNDLKRQLEEDNKVSAANTAKPHTIAAVQPTRYAPNKRKLLEPQSSTTTTQQQRMRLAPNVTTLADEFSQAASVDSGLG